MGDALRVSLKIGYVLSNSLFSTREGLSQLNVPVLIMLSVGIGVRLSQL